MITDVNVGDPLNIIDFKDEQPEKAFVPKVVTVLGKVTLVKRRQDKKVFKATDITELGQLNEVKPLYENALSLILLTVLGIFILFKFEQYINILFSIVGIELGQITDVNPLYANANPYI